MILTPVLRPATTSDLTPKHNPTHLILWAGFLYVLPNP